jgi:hypothetical protein
VRVSGRLMACACVISIQDFPRGNVTFFSGLETPPFQELRMSIFRSDLRFVPILGMFLSYKRSLLRSFGSQQLRVDLLEKASDFYRESLSRENFSMGIFSREKIPRNNFSRGSGNGARRFAALVTEMAALMAAVVRWRRLTPRVVLKPARSTGRFQPFRRNKAATDTARHVPASSTCMP